MQVVFGKFLEIQIGNFHLIFASSNKITNQFNFTTMAKFSIERARGAEAVICTEEMFDQVIKDPTVAHNCEMYRETGEDRFKRRLPGICFHAWFTDNKRHEESAQPSGLFIFDIDKMREHLQTDARTFYDACVKPHIAELGVLIAHITPSDNGLRLVAPLRPGMNIAQSQEWMGKKLGVEYDACVKDLARLSFLVPEDHFLYMDRASLFAVTENLPAMVQTKEEEEIPTLEAEVVPPTTDDSLILEDTFKGIPYAKIVEKVLIRTGGEPVEGERNNRLFTTARYLRYICDFDADRLFAIMPRFGLPAREVMDICKNAIKSTRGSDIPDLLKEIISDCKRELDSGGNGQMRLISREMPKRLPPLIHQFAKTAPDAFKAPTVMAMLPLMGTLATRLRFSYLDGCIHSPSFMACIMGSQASGKSFIRRPEQILLEHIRQQDELERQKEIAYEESLRKAKNSNKQPEEPKVCIRRVPVSISIAKLLKRLDNARGKHLISICEEIDTLNKTNRAGAWSEKTDLMRNAFDNTEYGQDYMSSNSYSTTLSVYYNLLFCGTPSSVYRFFKPHLTDGLVSRTIFTSLPDNFGGDIPIFKPLSDKDMEEIANGIIRLENAEGEVQLPKLSKAITSWQQEKRQLAMETQSLAIDTFRKRSAVIGFRAGALAYLLNENKEDRMVTNFACWVADYVLQQQVICFGQAIEDSNDTMSSNQGTVQQLFSILPTEFTRKQLIELRIQANQGDNVRTVIHRWKKCGMIEETGKNTYIKLMRGCMEDFYHPQSA